MDGKNTMDFFDADIEERLRALEEEEAQLEANGAYAPEEDDGEDLDEEEMVLYEAIKEKQEIARKKNHETKSVIPKMFALRGRSEGNNNTFLSTYRTQHILSLITKRTHPLN